MVSGNFVTQIGLSDGLSNVYYDMFKGNANQSRSFINGS